MRHGTFILMESRMECVYMYPWKYVMREAKARTSKYKDDDTAMLDAYADGLIWIDY